MDTERDPPASVKALPPARNIKAPPSTRTVKALPPTQCSETPSAQDAVIPPARVKALLPALFKAAPSAQGSEIPPAQGNVAMSAGDKPVYVPKPHSETSPASTDADEFVLVQHKSQKRKLKASKSTANPAKKQGVAVPSTSQSAAPPAEDEDSNMEEPPRPPKVPPLYIREKRQWGGIIAKLDSLGIEFSTARSTLLGIRVQCPNADHHRRLTAYLRSANIGYHTYALPEERMLRAVIRGLPRELSTEYIKQDLVAQGIPVTEVHRMYHNRTKQPYDMVLVIAQLDEAGKKIFRLESVCRLSGLRIEPPKNRGKTGQCHRCQLYGHSARNCYAHPRCVKCLGDHGTADCVRKQPTEVPPSCVLCGAEGHPANYRGCPKAPKEQKRKGKSAGRKPAPAAKPVPKFVPAPAPAVNAWDKPLPRANNGPGPAPARAAAAQPARKPAAAHPSPAPRPCPAPAAPLPRSPCGPQSSAAERLSDNLAYVGYIIDSIDIDELDVFVQKAKTNFSTALCDHAALLISINNCRKTLNG